MMRCFAQQLCQIFSVEMALRLRNRVQALLSPPASNHQPSALRLSNRNRGKQFSTKKKSLRRCSDAHFLRYRVFQLFQLWIIGWHRKVNAKHNGFTHRKQKSTEEVASGEQQKFKFRKVWVSFTNARESRWCTFLLSPARHTIERGIPLELLTVEADKIVWIFTCFRFLLEASIFRAHLFARFDLD